LNRMVQRLETDLMAAYTHLYTFEEMKIAAKNVTMTNDVPPAIADTR